MRKLNLISVLFLFITMCFVSTLNAGQEISVKGYAYIVEKPDIAHVFIKIIGKGNNYKTSEEQANSKLEKLTIILQSLFNKDISPVVIKVHSEASSKFNVDNYDEYAQEYFIKMAKAMKGEVDKKQFIQNDPEFLTVKNIYFSIDNYTLKNLNILKNKLSSKKLAFNESSSMYDFMPSFELNKSYIVYGISDPNVYMEKLSKMTYENAKSKAKSMLKSMNMNLGNVIKINNTCNSQVEGDIDISEANRLLGKNIGPVSFNPNRIAIQYQIKYTFEVK